MHYVAKINRELSTNIYKNTGRILMELQKYKISAGYCIFQRNVGHESKYGTNNKLNLKIYLQSYCKIKCSE